MIWFLLSREELKKRRMPTIRKSHHGAFQNTRTGVPTSMTARRLVSLVDDDESLRRSVKNLLNSVGVEVETFESAEAFLKSTEFDQTSCLILDLRLDGMSGLELMSFMSTIGRSPPVIMLTAHGDDEVRRRALLCGAVAFMAKPFLPDNLIDQVNAVLSPAGGGSPTAAES
jgi:FixJ family two-component response regulator